MNAFNLTIISLKEILYNDFAVSVTVPSAQGELTILKDHIPLISTLKPGQIKVKTENTEHLFNLQKGLLEIRPTHATILIS